MGEQNYSMDIKLPGLIDMGSHFGIVSHFLWLYSLKYNSMMFEYIIVREMENQ
jgi:hypothetical protein